MDFQEILKRIEEIKEERENLHKKEMNRLKTELEKILKAGSLEEQCIKLIISGAPIEGYRRYMRENMCSLRDARWVLDKLVHPYNPEEKIPWKKS